MTYNVTVVAVTTVQVDAANRWEAERAALESVSLGDLEVDCMDVSQTRPNRAEAHAFSE